MFTQVFKYNLPVSKDGNFKGGLLIMLNRACKYT